MKLYLIIISMNCFTAYGQSKYKWLSKKDIAPMLLCMGAGYSAGIKDEISYHPNQLFQQYPNLSRKFWDVRHQNPPTFLNTEWDGEHIFKGATVLLFVGAVTFKIGERKKWYWYIVDGVKYFIAYHVGFAISYNIQMKNKL
jgi:hypothetical protein